jgi:RimJ/RimL family protein N-acetyltransferase
MNKTDKLTKDKTGADVIVKTAPALGGSPVLPFFLRGYADLIDQGFAWNNLAGHNKNGVIYAEINGEIAGFIVYDLEDDVAKTCWIVFGTVVEKFRRRGLYQIIHDRLIELAKYNGCSRIFSYVHVNNNAMLELNKKLGKLPSPLVRHELQL